jgi:tetratricopeptide (TPR) repeat protein
MAAARQTVLDAPRSATAWGEYGLVLRAYAQHAGADVCFRTAAALDPADGRWPYLLGIHLAGTDPAAAVEWLRKAAGASIPDDTREVVRLRLAETLLAADRPEEARAVLGPEPPASARGRLAVARVAAATGDDRRAAELLSDLATHPAAARQALTLQSQIYQRQNRPAVAGETSRRALAAPDVPWPDPIADEVARRDHSWAGRLDEAARLLRAGRPAAAEVLLRPLTADSPDARPFVGLAEARIALGDRPGALRALQDGVRVGPRDVSVNYQLGLYHFEDGERLWHGGRKAAATASFRDAVARFDIVLAVEPNFGKALLLKGAALQRFLDRPDEGISLIRRFVELRPEVAEGHFLLGQALAATNQTTAARDALRKAVELAPRGDHRAAAALRELDKPPVSSK